MCQPLSYQTEEVIDLRLQSSELLSIVGQRPKIKGAKNFGQKYPILEYLSGPLNLY